MPSSDGSGEFLLEFVSLRAMRENVACQNAEDGIAFRIRDPGFSECDFTLLGH